MLISFSDVVRRYLQTPTFENELPNIVDVDTASYLLALAMPSTLPADIRG